MKQSVTEQFLRRIAWRQNVVCLAQRWTLFLWAVLGAYALGLLLSRLIGVIPNWFTQITFSLVPVVAAILAAIFHQRAGLNDAARVADTELHTQDLFLTASLIRESLGEYQELVLNKAEERATGAVPGKIVPFRWRKGAVRILAAVTIVLAGVYLLPQFDPFGLHKQQRQLAEQRERIRDIEKATAVRAALLEQKRAGEQTDVVKQAVANLEKTFQLAKTNDQAGTLARLNEQQKLFGQLWKQVSDEKLQNALNVPPPSQNFGLADPAKTEQLRNDLQKGDVSSANKELDELKRKADELAASHDPVEREKLRQEIMDRLQSLKDTLAQQMDSQTLDADLQRALEQLAMANLPSLSGEALKGMCNSLKLTQDELRQLAKAMADMKNIEEALKALQMAKALHGMKPLDGQDFVKLGDLAAYSAFCKNRCQSLCAGMGMGPGQGIGPRPYGDEKSETAFQSEKTTSLLQPGKMLMEWKTREVSEAGPAREEYLRAVQDVRQQASEAIVQEQIPPGYQGAIKQYFDRLHNDATSTPQP